MSSEAPAARQPGSFLGHVNVVLLTYVADGALAFASGVLVARALGPDGRGAYALFVVTTAFGQMLLGLGFGNATVYFLNKGTLALRQVVSAVHVVVLVSPAITALALLAVVPWAGADVLGAGLPAWLLVAAVPALIWSSALIVTLQAQSRFVAMGLATLTQPAVMLALVALLYATDRATPVAVAWCWIASNIAAAAFALSRIGLPNVDAAQVVRPRPAVLRALAGFGVQGEAGNILQLMNYRLDQYIVRAFVSVAGVGVYAVGVSLTEGVWLLANAVALVLLPRLTAAADEESRWITPVATRNTLLVAACAAAALAAVAPAIVPLFFGRAYDGAVRALWWLLPGTVALTGSKVLTSYIFSQGKPLVNTLITVVSLAVTTGALFVLVPAYGISGAAAASSLAYGAHFAVALIAYGRISGASPLDALLPRPADARLYADAVRSARARLSRGDAVGARPAGG